MFCRRHGIDLPQAGIRSTIFITQPAAEVTPGGLVTPDFTLSRRLDGGYVVAAQNRGQLEITPQGLRYARQFWPTFRTRRKSLRLGIGRVSSKGRRRCTANGRWTRKRRSSAIAFSPRHRTPASWSRRCRRVAAAYPALAGMRMASIWGGWIDCTPDSVPVISAVDQPARLLPGDRLQRPRLRHRPGRRPLAADLVAGDTPVVDPRPYRYSRMVDGTDLDTPGLM